MFSTFILNAVSSLVGMHLMPLLMHLNYSFSRKRNNLTSVILSPRVFLDINNILPNFHVENTDEPQKKYILGGGGLKMSHLCLLNNKHFNKTKKWSDYKNCSSHLIKKRFCSPLSWARRHWCLFFMKTLAINGCAQVCFWVQIWYIFGPMKFKEK